MPNGHYENKTTSSVSLGIFTHSNVVTTTKDHTTTKKSDQEGTEPNNVKDKERSRNSKPYIVSSEQEIVFLLFFEIYFS